MMGRHALVTGGAGFIGAHLVARMLAEGWSVTIVDDLSRGRHDALLEDLLRHSACRFVESNMSTFGGEGIDDDAFSHIVHLAAVVGVQNVIGDPERVLRTNVDALHSVIDIASRQAGLERLLFPSTSEVYAGTLEVFGIPFPTPEDVPLTVADVSDARTSYLLSKIYGEALVSHIDVPSTVVRPHNVYGPRMGDAHVIPQLLRRIRAAEGGEVAVHSPGHSRTFCFVDDAVEYLLRLLMSPQASGLTVNLGVEVPEITMRELAQLLVEIVGADVEVVDGDVHPGSPARRQPDVRLLRDLTGYMPAVGLVEGVSRTWAWYRERLVSTT